MMILRKNWDDLVCELENKSRIITIIADFALLSALEIAKDQQKVKILF